MNNNKELRMLLIKHKEATRFLYICAETKKDEIPAFMAANGFNYVEGVMYKTAPVDLTATDPHKFDMLLLFSPTGINALFHNYPKFEQGKLRIAAYGKITADSVLDKGLTLHLMAPLGHTLTIMVALDHYLKESNK
jgi:uroporphyrinogen-III synthase